MTDTLRGQSRLALSEAFAAMLNPIVCLVVAVAIVGLASDSPAGASEMLRCARFEQGEFPTPVPSPYPSAIERADRISHAVKSARYPVLFFGDSLTEGWDTTDIMVALHSAKPVFCPTQFLAKNVVPVQQAVSDRQMHHKTRCRRQTMHICRAQCCHQQAKPRDFDGERIEIDPGNGIQCPLRLLSPCS